MSYAWETTIEDVEHVLEKHGLKLSEKEVSDIHDNLDFDEIEDAVLNYTMMESQCKAMYYEIETQLMNSGVLTGERQCNWV